MFGVRVGKEKLLRHPIYILPYKKLSRVIGDAVGFRRVG